MTIERMIELLEIEHECMLRGAHDDCDRKCTDCELVQEDDELHEMYTNVVWLLKEQETMMQCIKGKCRICPHCANCDVDDNGLLKEQEAKTGHWVFGSSNGHSWMKCSQCLVSQDGQTACFSFCPNCGASMEEEPEHIT